MAMVDADWSITRSSGNIRYIGDAHGGASPSYATVIEFHRWLQDFADDAVSSGDDELDITDSTPSDRSTDNIITLINSFNIDQTSAEHLYDGSITQAGGNDQWAGLVVVGSVPDPTTLLIVQDNAFYDSASAPYWGATSGGTALNGDADANIIMRTLVPVRTSGSNVDGKRIRVQAQELGDTYAEFSLTGGQGNSTAAIFTSGDLNNATAQATIATWDQFTNATEGFSPLDVTGDGSDEDYYSEWQIGGGATPASPTINDLYEYTKWTKRRGTGSTLYGLSGDLFRGITHEIDVDTPTGTFQEPEALSWTGGTGQLLAIDSTTAPTKIWIQLLTGVTPSDNDTITGGTSSATALVNVTVTSRTVAPSYLGSSTGSAIIGTYGIGIRPSDLTASDQLFDLTDTLRVPPNNVTFTVSGLISGEDRVLVGPEDGGGGLDVAQLSLNTTLSGATETAIVTTTTIPTDTPASGTIRVQLDDGTYRLQNYDSYTGSTFTIPSTDYSGGNTATAANNIFVSYIDTLASSASENFTSVFDATRTLFIRVRDGGGTPIKTFETTGTLGSAGGSSTAIRTSDE